MTLETWLIEYDLWDGDKKVIKIKEEIQTTQGHHNELKRFWDKNSYEAEDRNPIYKMRGNHIEFFLGGKTGFCGELPLNKETRFGETILFVNFEHPIKLVAPDGTLYERYSD